MTIAEMALSVALHEVGVKEDPPGSNSGPRVNDYLRAVKLKPGNYWCMAFLVWCFTKVGCKTISITGGCLDQWNRSKKYAVAKEQVQPGDVGIMKLNKKGAGHTFIVRKKTGNKLNTVEGNSNNNGSSNGEAVVLHERDLNNPLIIGFLRFT